MMFALEIINALNQEDAPVARGATMRLSMAPRCSGACGRVKGHPKETDCVKGWPPDDIEGRLGAGCASSSPWERGEL